MTKVDDILKEIENEICTMDFLDLSERFINILGGFDVDRLENILKDIRGIK